MGAEREANFRRVYDDHSRAVLRYAARRAASPEDAADIVAETFLIAWRKFEDVPEGDDARFWLYAVAYKTLATFRRREVNRRRLGESLKDLIAREVDQTRVSDEIQLTRAALATLDEHERELIRLSVWEGLDSKEIAAVVGVPPSTVRTRLSRVRHKLRGRLNSRVEA